MLKTENVMVILEQDYTPSQNFQFNLGCIRLFFSHSPVYNQVIYYLILNSYLYCYRYKKMLSAVVMLTYRNIVAVVDKLFLIWQILFPLVYIFVAGYAYSSLINEDEIVIGGKTISYNVFLALGMIGFNVMNSSTVAGSIIWNDKRNGMLHQILVMPYSKLQYIASTLLTIIIMGLASAAIILIAGLPIIAGTIHF